MTPQPSLCPRRIPSQRNLQLVSLPRPQSSKPLLIPLSTPPSAPSARASKRIKQKLDFGQDDDAAESAPKTPRNAPKKLVSFTQAGPLSPKKRLRSRGEVPKTILKAPASSTATSDMISFNDLNVPNAPKKKPIHALSLPDIKGKLALPENARIVRESLKQFAELDRKRQELRKLNAIPVKPVPAIVESPGKQLKPFSAIELDIER